MALVLNAAAGVAMAELQWRAAPRVAQQTAAAVRPATMVYDASVRQAAAEVPMSQRDGATDEPSRSVIVRREGTPGVAIDGGYDPFDEDDSLSVAARMPEVEPTGEPETDDPLSDPFEADDALQQQAEQPADEAPIEPEQTAPADEAAVEPESTDAPSTEEETEPTADAAEEPLEAPRPKSRPAKSAASEPLPTPSKPRETSNSLRDEVAEDASDEVVRGAFGAESRLNAMREVAIGPLEDELAGSDSDPAEKSVGAGPDIDFENLESHLQAAPDESNQLPPLTPEQLEARRKELEQERLENERDCQEIQKIVKQRNIESISLDIRLKGTPGEDFPFGCGLGEDQFTPRSWPEITYLWKAAALCHKPLRFEQPQLERYGHDCGPVLQPIVSGAHFFATLPVLPYSMGIESPNECIYTLGYYRPGSCAPYMIPAMPFTWRAAFYEGAAWTGGVFLFP